MTRSEWDRALEDYYQEHDSIGTAGDARGPALLQIKETGRTWEVRQVIDDPEGHRDWIIEAAVDLDASDSLGQAIVTSRSEEHTSELQSIMRISYAVFCLKKKTQTNTLS